MSAEVIVVQARDAAPEWWDAAVFLAGPTPRSPAVASWRPAAVEQLRAGWRTGRLVIFVPEDAGGGMHGTWHDQVAWEERNLHRADVIAFWVPRDLATLPGFTTNVEFGRWYGSGKAVLGAPPDAPGTRYLRHYADAPVDTLPDLVRVALDRLGDPARRTGAERDVPLHLWHRTEFRSWYDSQRAAGNELRAARAEWSTRPLFLWILAVEVWIRAEDRVKSNEVVLLRPDAVAVLLYRPGATLAGTEIVLVREYRSATRTADGYLWELPGGSGPGTPREQAIAEVAEETGLTLDPAHLRYHGSRQVAPTLSAHHTDLFSVELTGAELDRHRTRGDVPYGRVEDSERTFVEVTTYGQILAGNAVDWPTLGQLAQVLGRTVLSGAGPTGNPAGPAQ